MSTDHGDTRRFRRRASVLLVAMMLGFAAAGLRSAQLQIVRHAELARLAVEEYLDDVKVPARRGRILDRDRKPLAISVDVPSVFANPSKVTDPRRAARELASVLEMPRDTVYRRLASERLFVWLRRQVTPEMAERVRALGIEGIAITAESRRYYPNREVAAHILGFTGVDAHGLEGIELMFDEYLAGEAQVVEAVRDGRGRAVLAGGLDPEQRSIGEDVRLTIDLEVQHAAEQALATAVRQTGALAATAVVLDSRTGAVLAMAMAPSFNPNSVEGSKQDERRNRAVADMFEPGSTVKPLVVAAALDSGVVAANDLFFCENGAYVVGPHTIRDPHPRGWLDLTGILKYSSNIGASKVGEKLGRTRLGEALSRLGFGDRTGVELPGESRGLLRPPGNWSSVGLANMAFGHGMAVNTLQLAAAFNVLATGGVYRRPYLAQGRIGPDGREELFATTAARRVFGNDAVAKVVRMLEAAVSEDGTGYRASTAGYRVAGKTGTAQKPDLVAGGYTQDRFMSVFSGFLPVESPRAVITVVVDEPKTQHAGGAVAAPIFAEIGAATMRALGVAPTQIVKDTTVRVAQHSVDEGTEVDAVVAPSSHDGDGLPSYLGLTARQALERYARVDAPYEVEMQGSGKVVRQEPAPGREAAGVRRVKLTLAMP